MPVLPRFIATRIAARIASEDSSRPLWRHPASIAAAVLALTLATVPLLPDGDDDQGTITPSGEATRAPGAASGRGEVTPEMQAEIDRVLAEGASLDRAQGRTSLARASVRCATFEGQRYCLGFGWTNQSRETLASRMTAPPAFGRESTGDLDADGLLARASSRNAVARTEAERAELTAAAQSVGKVWMLRHEIQGVRCPTGSPSGTRRSRRPTCRHAAGSASRTRRSRRSSPARWPRRRTRRTGAAPPRCRPSAGARRGSGRTSPTGPAASAPLRRHGHHRHGARGQQQDRLRRVTHAGPYVVLDISDFTFKQWYRLMMRHIHDYQSPVVLHPVLLKAVLPLPRRRRQRALPGRARLRLIMASPIAPPTRSALMEKRWENASPMLAGRSPSDPRPRLRLVHVWNPGICAPSQFFVRTTCAPSRDFRTYRSLDIGCER